MRVAQEQQRDVPGAPRDTGGAVTDRAPGEVDGRPGTAGASVEEAGARQRGRVRSALHARRERLRSDAHANRVYRTAVALTGTSVALLGLVLVPLPGPGWLVVFLGLAVLGSEFHWARRLHRFGVRTVARWTAWVARRSWPTRGALGALALAAVAGLGWGWLQWQGVPAWSPEVVTAQLVRIPGV